MKIPDELLGRVAHHSEILGQPADFIILADDNHSLEVATGYRGCRVFQIKQSPAATPGEIAEPGARVRVRTPRDTYGTSSLPGE